MDEARASGTMESHYRWNIVSVHGKLKIDIVQVSVEKNCRTNLTLTRMFQFRPGVRASALIVEGLRHWTVWGLPDIERLHFEGVQTRKYTYAAHNNCCKKRESRAISVKNPRLPRNEETDTSFSQKLTIKLQFQSNSTCPVVVYVHGGSALFSGALMFPDEVLATNYARQGEAILDSWLFSALPCFIKTSISWGERWHKIIINLVSSGVILITIAYRVGVFGVMALGDENALPANLAMHGVLWLTFPSDKKIYRLIWDQAMILQDITSLGKE